MDVLGVGFLYMYILWSCIHNFYGMNITRRCCQLAAWDLFTEEKSLDLFWTAINNIKSEYTDSFVNDTRIYSFGCWTIFTYTIKNKLLNNIDSLWWNLLHISIYNYI